MLQNEKTENKVEGHRTDMRSTPKSADSKNKPEKKEAQKNMDDKKETSSDAVVK